MGCSTVQTTIAAGFSGVFQEAYLRRVILDLNDKLLTQNTEQVNAPKNKRVLGRGWGNVVKGVSGLERFLNRKV